MSPVLRVEDVSYIYGAGTPFERRALEGVSLSVEAGEALGIIGHTGSGKSTLIQHFNGLLKPAGGRVFFEGRDIWADARQVRSLRFQVGLVFQYPEYQLFEETVARDIAFGPRNMGLSDGEVDDRVRRAMRFVGLPPEAAEKSPFDLSGGQKRRAAIAGVIAMDPRVLVLDEPTAGLDPQGRDEILSHLRAYHKERGAALVLVSHGMDEVARQTGRIAVLAEARVLMEGTPREVFSRAGELEAAGLSAPAVTRVMRRLKATGLPVDASAHTVEQAAESILAARRAFSPVR
jgi:energy-coupling factor transport system ATP-binding protein